jgi:hypothetical protein
MKNLTQEECIEICKLINPNLKWEWNDHFNSDEPPFYAINGTSNSGELYMLRFYYNKDKITLIDGNSANMDEQNIDFQSKKEILKILGVELDKSSSSDESKKMIFNKYVKKITDRFSTTVEYRMKESVVLDNNEGLPYNHIVDINLRVFVENNDFLNSKIVLALTFYAPEPGTGTILHESVADVMLDNKDVFKLNNEYSYSGLDYYGAQGNRLEICDETLADESSRIEQIQFYIDLTTLIKIVNAKTFEIRFNKKWDYGGKFYDGEIIKLVGFYNALFDHEFNKIELIDIINNDGSDGDVVALRAKVISLYKTGRKAEAKKVLDIISKINANSEKTDLELGLKNNQRIIEYCKQGKKIEAIQIRKEFSGEDLVTSKKYVEDLCLKNRVEVEKKVKTEEQKKEEDKNFKKTINSGCGMFLGTILGFLILDFLNVKEKFVGFSYMLGLIFAYLGYKKANK